MKLREEIGRARMGEKHQEKKVEMKNSSRGT
jgi:hypothetical protein